MKEAYPGDIGSQQKDVLSQDQSCINANEVAGDFNYQGRSRHHSCKKKVGKVGMFLRCCHVAGWLQVKEALQEIHRYHNILNIGGVK